MNSGTSKCRLSPGQTPTPRRDQGDQGDPDLRRRHGRGSLAPGQERFTCSSEISRASARQSARISTRPRNDDHLTDTWGTPGLRDLVADVAATTGHCDSITGQASGSQHEFSDVIRVACDLCGSAVAAPLVEIRRLVAQGGQVEDRAPACAGGVLELLQEPVPKPRDRWSGHPQLKQTRNTRPTCARRHLLQHLTVGVTGDDRTAAKHPAEVRPRGLVLEALVDGLKQRGWSRVECLDDDAVGGRSEARRRGLCSPGA